MTGIEFNDSACYTEATHTVYARVRGAQPVTAGARDFTPQRITVKYALRTHSAHPGWQVTAIELSGPWVSTPDNPLVGSGMLLLWLDAAPNWAREFVVANMPHLRLTE